MDYKTFVFLLSFILSCSSGPVIHNGGSAFNDECTYVTPAVNLAPYIGRCIILKGTVTVTGYPSISDYWIAVPELESHRGEKIALKGVLMTRKEETGKGSDEGSGRGVYFINVISIDPLR